MKERFVYAHNNYRKNKQVSFLLYKLNKTNTCSCGEGGLVLDKGCRRRGIYKTRHSGGLLDHFQYMYRLYYFMLIFLAETQRQF